MRPYVLIAEVPYIDVPCPIEIISKNFNFNLYPLSIKNNIKRIKKSLGDINNFLVEIIKNPIEINLDIRKIKNTSSLIVTPIIDEEPRILTSTFDYFQSKYKLLLRCFNLFFTHFFEIVRIFIFEKKKTTWKFKRMLEKPSRYHSKFTEGEELIKNSDARYIEGIAPEILNKLEEKEIYTDIFDEFVLSKIETELENKILMAWNTLEHLSERFLKENKMDKIIKSEKFAEIRIDFKSIVNKIKPDELNFYKNLDRAKSIIYKSLKNYPHIKDKILFMLKMIGFKYKGANVEELVNEVYYLRNQISHSGIFLPQLIRKFETKFKRTNLSEKDLLDTLNLFISLIEDVIFRTFSIQKDSLIEFEFEREWKNNNDDYNQSFNLLMKTEDDQILRAAGFSQSSFKSVNHARDFLIRCYKLYSRK